MDIPLHPRQDAITGAADNSDERRQHLLDWLAQPTRREQRRYLETHPELLAQQSDVILSKPLAEQTGREEKQFREALRVLQDARTRGGTEQAIRETYVDTYGGFALDLPEWLMEVEQRLISLKQTGQADQTAAARMGLLQEALKRAQQHPGIVQEILATLRHELALALHKNPQQHKQHLEAALACCSQALSSFTRERYGYQYAQVQTTLGNIYGDRIEGNPRDNIEEALNCYRRSLQIFTLHDFPGEYAQVQAKMGEAYRYRIAGEKRDNVELALGCLHEALHIFTLESSPHDYAETYLYLGSAYWERIAGDQRENFELAIACLHESLRVFTVDAYPNRHSTTQNNLGLVYRQRVAGEKRENLEHALVCFQASLQGITPQSHPHSYAISLSNLALAYTERIAGDRRENLERAIAYRQEALRIFTLDAYPFDHALVQNNLGSIYQNRIAGEKRANLEQAMAYYQQALRVFTLDAYPFYYAKTSGNLGVAYRERLVGDRQENLGQAIASFNEALRVYTREAYPYEYARLQNHLGMVYRLCPTGEQSNDLAQALQCFQEALQVYTLSAFPLEYRTVLLSCAETQAQPGDWLAAHEAYAAAREAEDLLVALGAGTVGRDAILKEGRDAAGRDGFALARLGRIEEAVVAIERGRARGLAEAMQFNAADPALISDEGRRARYLEARQAFIAAQAALHAPLPADLDEDGLRRVSLERTATYRTAKAVFDALVAAIREAQDPADFLNDTFADSSILEAAERCGSGHALVYLVATPWGGLAVAAFAAHPGLQTAARFAAFDLPTLTTDLLSELLETRLGDDADRVTGGFVCALQGNAFELLRAWPGQTLREQAEVLHAACQSTGHMGTLDVTAQEMLSIPELLPLVDQPLDTPGEADIAILRGTLAHALLQRELERCLGRLGEVLVRPIMAWLREEGATSITLIPCGPLSAFPLANVRMLGETLSTSIAPSARSLWRDTRTMAESVTQRQGIYALGNPAPTQQELRWGEAEALTLAKLAQQLGLPSSVRVQWQATRDWLLTALHAGQVVDASCHGRFDTVDYLRSRLILANQKEVTLADLLSYQIDVRGLRLLILSACQTALLDLSGARDEVHSLAAGMLQVGVDAVLAALWPVDDKATYLLMVRFAQEWLPRMAQEAPAAALARAQRWLRTVTNQALQVWQASIADAGQTPPAEATTIDAQAPEPAAVLPGAQADHLVAVRGGGVRFDTRQAQERIRETAEEEQPEDCPYADPYYWASFQVVGW